MKLVYNVNDKPPIGKLIVFSLQQLMSILAATILVPLLIGNGLTPAAALCGAGFGTLIYLLITKGRSPVFLGSSFAFLGALGAAAPKYGLLGILIGGILAGLVYVIVSLIIKGVGVNWLNKLLPPVIIGPTVALIGLSLSGSAINNVQNTAVSSAGYSMVHILVGLFTLAVTIICSTYGKKTLKMLPFIIGIGAGYVLSIILSVIGNVADVSALQLINFDAFKNMEIFAVPDFTFVKAFDQLEGFDWGYVASIALLFCPVAFVALAEHIADHKNLSTIIEKDLLTDPGLDKTIMGDGIGTMIGAFFGGCPNTTYGESVGCVAITKNASIYSILGAAVAAVILSFFGPFVTFAGTIPACVIGGVCIALYGFIAVSGLKMIQKVDLNLNKNLFVVAAILIPGIGGLTLKFGDVMDPIVTVTNIATALVLGILVNLLVSRSKESE
ncbi:MAG: uracil-xanthine permease [Clostridia bacterium]|nr:uracil-xanthine permease [Clostridia bacterium]